jgi:transcription elongation factor GreA
MLDVVYLTPDGQAKLEHELGYLRDVKRREVAARLREAMDEGDDPEESAAYEAARNDQAFLEGRISDIEALLARARLIEPSEDGDIVRIGSTVVVREEGGEVRRYRLVGRVESDPRMGKISYESPLGEALLDRRAGEVVEVRAPDGLIQYHILKVE